MFALGIPKKQYRRTTQVLGSYMSNPTNYEAEKQDDGFYIFTFPDADEDDFKGIVYLLKKNGVTTIGADSQLTEEKIMKLSNLIKEQNIGGFLNIPYLAAAWNSIYDTNVEEVNPMFPVNFDLADWTTNFYNTVQGVQNPENFVMNQANAWAETINNAQANIQNAGQKQIKNANLAKFTVGIPKSSIYTAPNSVLYIPKPNKVDLFTTDPSIGMGPRDPKEPIKTVPGFDKTNPNLQYAPKNMKLADLIKKGIYNPLREEEGNKGAEAARKLIAKLREKTYRSFSDQDLDAFSKEMILHLIDNPAAEAAVRIRFAKNKPLYSDDELDKTDKLPF